MAALKVIDRSGCAAKKHGDWMAYTNYGCRCKDARWSWNQDYKVPKRNGTFVSQIVDATGTHRRLQALIALGWSNAAIARVIGQNKIVVCNWLSNSRVRASTADKVKKVYDELSMLPGPKTASGSRSRNRAKKAGWPPPLAWDDETIDDPSTPKPTRPRASGASTRFSECPGGTIEEFLQGVVPISMLDESDRLAVIAQLSQNHSVAQIATRVGLGARTVQRYRARLRQAAA